MKNVAIDTHFIERGRIVRMAQCIVTNPGCVGIGLEEDTAVFVTEGKEMLVVGSGLLTVLKACGWRAGAGPAPAPALQRPEVHRPQL